MPDTIEKLIQHVDTLIQRKSEKEEDFLPLIPVLAFRCENVERTFMISNVEITQESDEDEEEQEYGLYLSYHVLHCSYHHSMEHVVRGKKNATEIVHAIFHCLFDYHLCQECFQLTRHPEKLCHECIPYKLRDEYGRQFRGRECSETCTICLEPVYSSRLACGHFFHKTCFVRQNPQQWYSSSDEYSMEIHCPLCRAAITDQDKNTFFLSPLSLY